MRRDDIKYNSNEEALLIQTQMLENEIKIKSLALNICPKSDMRKIFNDLISLYFPGDNIDSEKAMLAERNKLNKHISKVGGFQFGSNQNVESRKRMFNEGIFPSSKNNPWNKSGD